MEEKIIGILQDSKNGISVEICKDALLNLCVVSQQRELLLNYNEYLAYMYDSDTKKLNDDIDHFLTKSKFNNCC